MSGEYILDFGKHEGKAIKDVPINYLLWLANRDLDNCDRVEDRFENLANSIWNDRDSILAARTCKSKHSVGCKCYVLGRNLEETTENLRKLIVLTDDYIFEEAWLLRSTFWLVETKPHVVDLACQYMDEARLCWYCGEVMPVIGHDRKNGADHADWAERCLHKKCYTKLRKQ